MNEMQNATTNPQESTPRTSQEQTIPIEVKWNLPAWMLKDQGPLIEVEDDDVEWQ